eukprot:16621-Chlamydomonas_euryale.AAC.6
MSVSSDLCGIHLALLYPLPFIYWRRFDPRLAREAENVLTVAKPFCVYQMLAAQGFELMGFAASLGRWQLIAAATANISYFTSLLPLPRGIACNDRLMQRRASQHSHCYGEGRHLLLCPPACPTPLLLFGTACNHQIVQQPALPHGIRLGDAWPYMLST